MKKLLVLVLVLAMASLASAATVWSMSNTAGAISVSVTENPGAYVYLALGITGGNGVLSAFAAGANAPASSANFADLASNFPEAGQGEIWIMIHVTTGTPVFNDGEWLTASAANTSTTEDALVTLYQFDDNTSELIALGPTATIPMVPEPATIALLCLGGLLLRKK